MTPLNLAFLNPYLALVFYDVTGRARVLVSLCL